MQSKPEQSRVEAVDATRRTRLAAERTELAWWRTGLTALAVALAAVQSTPRFRGGASTSLSPGA